MKYRILKQSRADWFHNKYVLQVERKCWSGTFWNPINIFSNKNDAIKELHKEEAAAKREKIILDSFKEEVIYEGGNTDA